MFTVSLLITTPAGNRLEAALHHPLQQATTSTKRLAVVSHPYGKLGGSMLDHVVVAVREELVSLGYTVLAYNSRGVGSSTGWGSFSSLPEAEDCQAVVDYLVKEHAGDGETDLLICGYSAGSLSASYARGPTSNRIRARHILVSYPASYLGLMTLWRTKPFTQALASIRNPCLFLYGREDTFARSNVDLWQESFTVELVDGVDHFWSNGRTTELQRRMRNWLSSPASQWDGTKQ